MTKYVISYDKNVNFSTLENDLLAIGCTIIEKFDSLAVLIVDAPNTEFSLVNGVLAYEIEQQIVINQQWHQTRICSYNLPMRDFYISRNKGAGTTVYLVDSGVDTSHPELSGADIQHLWSWNGDFTDTNGHGTGLSSILVGHRLGVSPDATLKSVKIPFGQTISVSILLNAFDAILSDHLLTGGIKVVNCSWTIAKSLILDSKIIELQEQGLVVVAAAGNTMEDANNFSPVGLNTVLGVAASDAYDRVISWATGFGSNWGPDVDITAPGIDVTTAILNGDTTESSGTSIAAAVVSGCVCQYIVDNPSVVSATQIQDMVIQSSRQDVLFRNENVYSTTPNRLIYLPYIELIASPAKDARVFEIQRGTSINIPITLTSPAAVMNISKVPVGASFRTAPSWVSLNEGVFTVSPPIDTTVALYVLEIEILTANNESIGYSQLSFKVYDSSPDELQDNELYTYHRLTENEEVYVVQSQCGGTFCAYTPSNCTQYKNCSCQGFNCSSA